MGYDYITLPSQKLSDKKKNKEWRRKHLDWATNRSFFNYNPVMKSVVHKKINYDLVNGILHMEDLAMILNPENVKSSYIPSKIQHWAIIDSKLNVLKGEEIKRVFDYKVIVTNPTTISQIEEEKKKELTQRLQEWMEQQFADNNEAQAELQKIGDFFSYEWQDMRERRANELLHHYSKEQNFALTFNQGFMDGMIVGEEIYQCSIEAGEPVLRRLNPNKVSVFRSGYSNKIEDADIIIIEDYWSPGRIVDVYHDYLTEKDLNYIENLPSQDNIGGSDEMGNLDARFPYSYFNNISVSDDEENVSWLNPAYSSLLPYDMVGNIRVIQMFWKSKRRIKEVKTYNKITGEPEYEFYDDNYVIDEDLGQEERIFWINEAWQGVKIGEEVYVNIAPCKVSYNRLSNPSLCHFGIVGSIYNINEAKPFSLVDMMKPFQYLYDIIFDRLNKLVAKNWGMILEVDLSKMPRGWDMDKWLYYGKTLGIAVIDSFSEGQYGAATGKIAGALNNASKGVINASDSQSIIQYTQLLEFIKNEMSDVTGISKQREGQVSSYETVGGTERATLQSTHITEWLFTIHDDVKRRALECFLETAKIAMRGSNKKFKYITSDNAVRMVDIDGDQFAESDYGLIVDASNSTQMLNQQLTQLAQMALQSQSINFSTLMKLYTTASMAEKQKYIEVNEKQIQQQRQQDAQAQQQQVQQQMQMQQQLAQQQQQFQMQLEQLRLDAHDELNKRDNETRIQVAEIQKESYESMNNRFNNDAIDKDIEMAKIRENARQFDEKMEVQRQKQKDDLELGRSKLDVEKLKARIDAVTKEKMAKMAKERQAKND